MRRITRSQRVRDVLTLMCVGALTVSTGCRRWRMREAPGAEPVGELVQAPRVSRGLEIEVWAIEDRGGDLARALERYEEPAPFVSPGAARRWRASGFRLVSVPAGDLDRLRGSLSLVAPVREESLMEARHWRPLARGARLGGETVLTADGPAPRNDGWARLLARAWAAPSVSPGRETQATLRLELVPQIVEPAMADSLENIEARLRGQARFIGDDGPVLMNLMLSVLLQEGQALLVVGEDPAADWSALAQTAPVIPGAADPNEGAGDEDRLGPGVPELVEPIDDTSIGVMEQRVRRPGRVTRSAASQPTGPGAPERRTLGEAILVGRLGLGTEEVRGASVLRAGRRAVIVLAPHVSGPYRILPRDASPTVEGR